MLHFAAKRQNNVLLGSTVRRSFWGCFPLAFVIGVNSFVDTMLAGALFSTHHLTAVGIATSVNTLFSAIMMIFAHGTYASHSNALGRGQRRKSGEIFTAGVLWIAVLGLLMASLIGIFALPIVRLFGAVTPEMQAQAVQYLRYSLLSCPLVALIYLVTLVVGIYGFRRQAFIANLIGFTTNILFSVLFIRLLPGAGLGALGLGTICSGVCSLTFCLLSVRTRHLPLWRWPRLAAFRWRRTQDVLVSGLTTSSNQLIDGLMAALINQLILASLGESGLTVYSIVLCFWRMAQIPSDAMDYAVAPLFGICYVRGDRSALKTTFLQAITYGLICGIGWILFIDLLSGPVLQLYLLWNNDLSTCQAARTGVLLTLLFAPFYFICRTMVTLFDASDSTSYSLTSAILPDSILLPLLLALTLPAFGFPALWICLSGNAALYLLLFYLFHVLRERKLPVGLDRLLHLDDGLCAEYPQIDVSISYDDRDISHLSETIQHFLVQENAGPRIAYMTALCLDELASDIVAHSRGQNEYCPRDLMDVKLISTTEDFQIIIRNTAAPYNPLDFEYESEPADFSKVGVMMAQRVAHKIDYDYVYNMNIVSIRIAK